MGVVEGVANCTMNMHVMAIAMVVADAAGLRALERTARCRVSRATWSLTLCKRARVAMAALWHLAALLHRNFSRSRRLKKLAEKRFGLVVKVRQSALCRFEGVGQLGVEVAEVGE